MFVNPTIKVDVTQRVVATLVACAVVMGSVGFYSTAQAANLQNISNTLTDSTPGLVSDHTIEFLAENTILATETITVEWDSRDDGAAGQAFGNIGTVTTGDLTITDAGGAVTPTGFVATADTIAFAGVAATAGETVTIVVAGVLTNPTKENVAGVGDSYEVTVDVANVAGPDSGATRVVIIDNVIVTAEVVTSFEFEVRPVATSTTVNGEATTGASSSTTIPFGELTPGPLGAEFLAQQLSVTSNAINGFVVTVEKDGELRSSTGADIDTFFDATNEVLPSAWASPDGTLGFGENGWGHWGMTTEDGDVFSAGAPDFTGTDEYIAVLDTPQVIFGHDSVCDGTTTGAGNAGDDDACLTEVGYKIEITSLQEAGDDYTATLTYIATPTF